MPLSIKRYVLTGISINRVQLEYIYTIKTRLKYICVRIYMFICSELIEETRRPPGLIFGMWGYFWPGSDKFESWDFFHTFDKVMT